MKRILIGAACALAMATAAHAAPAPAPAAAPAQPTFATTRIAEGVYLFRYMNHNALFVTAPEGVIATDPIAFRRPEAAQAYLAEIRKITQAPIRYLVYSHSHFDHSTGGAPFKAAGATVVAHVNARDRLLKVSNPDIIPVDEVVHGAKTLMVGSTRVDLIHVGRNHSDNALVMLLPAHKLLFTVDWAGNAPGAAGFGPDTWPDEWVEGLQRLLTLDWDRMAMGHGARLGTKADIQRQIEYMTDAKATARTLAESARCTPDGRAATPLLAKYDGYTTPANWDAALTRYCIYWNQGY